MNRAEFAALKHGDLVMSRAGCLYVVKVTKGVLIAVPQKTGNITLSERKMYNWYRATEASVKSHPKEVA